MSVLGTFVTLVTFVTLGSLSTFDIFGTLLLRLFDFRFHTLALSFGAIGDKTPQVAMATKGLKHRAYAVLSLRQAAVWNNLPKSTI